MILIANTKKVIKPANFNANFSRASGFLSWIGSKHIDSTLSGNDAKILSELISLRNIRKARGLQVYLQTRSLQSVAEELGHKQMDAKLLTSYLPEPLMDFFNARWIRNFQNAILFEAMKDSKYKLDAVNMTTKDIEEFLTNHGLAKLSIHLDHGFKVKNEVSNSNDNYFDDMTFMISSSLLQLLIAIRTVVENHNGKSEIFKLNGLVAPLQLVELNEDGTHSSLRRYAPKNEELLLDIKFADLNGDNVEELIVAQKGNSLNNWLVVFE